MDRPLVFMGCEGRDVRFCLREGVWAQALPRLLGLSRRQAALVAGEGRLLVEGAPVRARASLPAGTDVVLRLARRPPETDALPGVSPSPASSSPATEGLIVYCDPFVLAANKPAGMLVHGDGTGVRTLTDDVAAWVVAHGGDALPQALNRIDVATTGLVLFSLAEETQPAFDALVAGHDMDKRYLAVVEGGLKGPRDVTAAIGRDRHDARRMRISASGKPAVTHLRPLASSGRRTLVEARIETGRRHQIRLHLASMGTPIMGDALYGRQGADIEGGLALHAWRLSFEHPVTGERLTLEAPWPPRFDALGFSAAQLVR